MILNTIVDASQLNPSFNTISEIETQIITDLKFAIKHLPNQWDSSTTKTPKDFAKLLLSRIYFKQKNYTKTIEILNTIAIPSSTTDIYTIDLNTLEDNKATFVFNRFIKKDKLVFGTYIEATILLAASHNQNDNSSLAIENLKKLDSKNMIIESKTKNELNALIFEQWTTKLNLDGNRFYVLKSFNKAIKTLNIQPYQLILPIPENEILANLNTQQNPGY